MTSGRNVGGKIKQIREMKNITVDELAERSNLDRQQVQMIEDNQILPSLSPLIKIARALSVRLGTFLDDHEHLGPVVSRNNEKTKSASFSNKNIDSRAHLDFFALASGKSGRHMEPFIIDIQPSADKGPKTSTHEGEEFIYVLEGSVAIEYGKETYIIDQGDSIYYDSIIDHLVRSANKQTAKILAVVYTPV
jgi:transcriptional regulator with XRE-family HTH domain